MSNGASVLELARSGNQEAVGQLVAEYTQSVKFLAYSFSQSSGIEVEDLLQEIAMQFVRKWNKIIVTRKPEVYIKTIARNILIDHYRKVARRRKQIREVILFDARIAM
jgi:RNA polymerase sigma factor (sigma-70 family)